MVISTARRLFIMANINVTLRMDEQLKKQADELFSDFGLTFNAAMTMFVKQSVREQRQHQFYRYGIERCSRFPF
jgi:hypothetical protein